MKKVMSKTLWVFLGIFLILIVLVPLYFIGGFNKLIVKKQLISTYSLDVDSVLIYDSQNVDLYEKSQGLYYFGAADYKENMVYFPFSGLKNDGEIVSGYIDVFGKIVCSNIPASTYKDNLTEELCGYIEEIIPAEKYAIYTIFSDDFYAPYCKSYEDFKQTILWNRCFETSILLSSDINEDEITALVHLLATKHYPIYVTICTVDNDYLAPMIGKVIHYSAAEVSEYKSWKHDEDIYNLYEEVEHIEDYVTHCTSEYNYAKRDRMPGYEFSTAHFVIDKDTKNETEIFNGLDSVDGHILDMDWDYSYIMLNDDDLQSTIDSYAGHELSLIYNDEVIYTSKITSDMVYQNYALRLEKDESIRSFDDCFYYIY